MSAITGLFYLNNRPVEPSDVKQMVASLGHRGPDRTGVWVAGPVGMGHCALWTTPESRGERFPLANASEALVLTADARIDNRQDLIQALALRESRTGPITDGALILAAYEAWGEDCPARLVGDFAFCLWDGRRRLMFCARDHVGVKPFYYCCTAEAFAFASEIKALLQGGHLPRRLNQTRVADYILRNFGDRESTFFEDAFRLPPAHCLVVSPEGKRLWSYWSLDPKRELRLATNDEYTDAFREVFDEAVRCRLRSAHPIGSTLSGGLDSSTIACTARSQLATTSGAQLRTFSAIFPGLPKADRRKSDERRFIKAVLAGGGFTSHFVEADRLSPLADLDQIFRLQDEPVLAPNLYLHRALYQAAHQQDVRVFLDGIDGDTTVSHGLEYLAELAGTGRWLTLASESKEIGRKPGAAIRPWKLAWVYGLRPLLATFLSRFPPLPGGRSQLRWSAGTAVNPGLLQALDYRRRLGPDPAAGFRQARSARQQHYLALNDGLIPLTLEVLDKAAAEFALEPRYPFFDRRLMELCLALPPNQKLSQGWTRAIQRRAAGGVVPAEIQWRFGKADLSPNFRRGLLERERETLNHVILEGQGVLQAYYDLAALQAAYQRVRSEPAPNDTDILTVYGAAILGLWLGSSAWAAGVRRQRKEGPIEQRLASAIR